MGSIAAFAPELISAWQGERRGAAFFAALNQLINDPALSDKLTWLERLEATTAQRIAESLAEHGIDTGPDPADVDGLAPMAQHVAAEGWQPFIAGLALQLQPALDGFRESETRAPEAMRNIASFVTAHEVALIEFARREAAGNDNAIEAVRSFLNDA